MWECLHSLRCVSQIGPLLSGVGILSASCAAWVTCILFHRRERDGRAVEAFRTLYTEFWKDQQIGEVRAWVTNNTTYNLIVKPAISSRLETGEWNNDVLPEQNEVLEKIDLLCSMLVRAKAAEERYGRHMTLSERKLFSKLLNAAQFYERMERRNRHELLKYVETYCKEL